VERVNKQLGCL